ncbi:MAG: hypothetical protein M3015_02680, partial [Bacteroidota bacterium]|nr:hypothetical protein [Bacteroidota bacterium]
GICKIPQRCIVHPSYIFNLCLVIFKEKTKQLSSLAHVFLQVKNTSAKADVFLIKWKLKIKLLTLTFTLIFYFANGSI